MFSLYLLMSFESLSLDQFYVTLFYFRKQMSNIDVHPYIFNDTVFTAQYPLASSGTPLSPYGLIGEVLLR